MVRTIGVRTALIMPALTRCFYYSCMERPVARHSSVLNVVSVSVADRLPFGQPIRYEAVCATPNPCWQLERTEVTQKDRTYEIAMYGRYDGQPCIQIVGSINVSGTLQTTERGIYTLRFHRTDGTALERQVIVE